MRSVLQSPFHGYRQHTRSSNTKGCNRKADTLRVRLNANVRPKTSGHYFMGIRVALVSCVKSKQDSPAPAGELYTSPLFRSFRRYAEANADVCTFCPPSTVCCILIRSLLPMSER